MAATSANVGRANWTLLDRLPIGGSRHRASTDVRSTLRKRKSGLSGDLSALGHVWTAPWQELSDVLQHWSGAVTCPACWCGRWPLALMLCADRVPIVSVHLKVR